MTKIDVQLSSAIGINNASSMAQAKASNDVKVVHVTPTPTPKCKHAICATLADTIMWRPDVVFGEMLMTFKCIACNQEITTTPKHLEKLGMKYY